MEVEPLDQVGARRGEDREDPFAFLFNGVDTGGSGRRNRTAARDDMKLLRLAQPKVSAARAGLLAVGYRALQRHAASSSAATLVGATA